MFPSDEFLRRFDFPSVRATVAKRPRSIVPQQFLFLLNSPFMLNRAKAMVSRLEKMAETDANRIDAAYQLLFSRSPTDVELNIGLEFLNPRKAAWSADKEVHVTPWTQYAQTLLSSNESMFVR